MKHLHLNLNLTGVIVIIAVGVLLPVMLSTAVGIVALVIARDAGGIVTGVLAVSFAVTAMGGALITVVLTSKKARLARMQADFVANVSHELRTPLSAIRLYAQTLQSDRLKDDPEQAARCVATILRETEWLDMMIDRVLTWRASASDMLKLNMTPQDVTQAVNGAAERFRAMTDPDGLVFSVSVDTARPVLHDVRALNSVLLNILINAYKYTASRKRIDLAAKDCTDGYVVIEVRDNGIGLTSAEAKRVFQPFYRADDLDTATSGAGLGLAIAQYLIARHNGTITVESEKGSGSTFTIRLPSAETAT